MTVLKEYKDHGVIHLEGGNNKGDHLTIFTGSNSDRILRW